MKHKILGANSILVIGSGCYNWDGSQYSRNTDVLSRGHFQKGVIFDPDWWHIIKFGEPRVYRITTYDKSITGHVIRDDLSNFIRLMDSDDKIHVFKLSYKQMRSLCQAGMVKL